MPRPNIIFIMSDDHAAHAISAYGSRVNRTPHLDRIAEEGVRMDAVFCTNSICSPSRASILTGTYSHVNGVSSIWTEMDYRVPTFIDVLHERGYRTGMFGKWHLGEHGQSLPRGFDAWKIFPGQGDYVDPEMIDADGAHVVPGYATDIVTDLALDWIDDVADEPFVAMVHHKAPHRPWVPDEKHKHLYADGTIPEPETFFDDYETRSRAVRSVHMTIADDMGADDLKQEVPEHLRGEENRHARMSWKYQIYMRDYLQTVQSIDDNVGRLLDHLEEKGLAENTLVVYTSDQGFFLGDHGWFDKRLMFDQSLQMPMLIRWPAEIAAGSRCEGIITNVDFAATFLDIAGVDADEAMPTSQGRSFRALLRGEEVEDWPDAAYYRYWEHDDPIHAAPAHYGIRTARHKLIYYYGAGLGVPGASDAEFEPEWELYDLAADPTEVRNVADDPAYADIRADLEAKLAAYQARYDDEPYRGPGTPAPEWGPYDAELFERVQEYVTNIRATS
ncbi:sulfatase [Microbacterium sp. ZXX196]|uniref:sulfatase family protein n=1 Tax=Microbacterium sp. ZXX196 TaxID=2609291 RepID=UPI0012B9033B|nr:sulfatase [Microbacterium sp. ZXX196]MTE24790.1 sulfatase-like hydrolase/transferase [Microbacterium sp. ZXX196]